MSKKKQFTPLEYEVIKIIGYGDEFAASFNDIMAEFTGSPTQLKGVLSSLFQKDAITQGEYPGGITSYHLTETITSYLVSKT
jgi:hypothetical protein